MHFRDLLPVLTCIETKPRHSHCAQALAKNDNLPQSEQTLPIAGRRCLDLQNHSLPE